MHVWALGLSCETPAAPPDRAVALQKTPPKFHEKAPKREKKEIVAGRGKKKREIWGSPPFGAPPFGAHPSSPPSSGPHLSRFGPPTLRCPHPSGPYPTHTKTPTQTQTHTHRPTQTHRHTHRHQHRPRHTHTPTQTHMG